MQFAQGTLLCRTADWRNAVAQQSAKRFACLLRQYPIAECGELFDVRESEFDARHPTDVESHEPFDKCWRRAWASVVAQKRRRGRSTASGLFPSGHGFGVSSPASKSCPINDHRLSGSWVRGYPCGPWTARSII